MIEITCPSGLIFQASELHGSEIVALAERIGPNTTGDFWSAIVHGCHLRTLDAGPYGFVKVGDAKPNWDRLAWGDLMSSLIRIRIETFRENPQLMRGNAYDFEFSCLYCKKLSPGFINLADLLANDFHYREATEAQRDLLSRDAFASTKLPSGPEVWFDVMRAEQDGPMKRAMAQAKPPRRKETDIEGAAKRVKRVEGLVHKDGNARTDLVSIWRWVERLGLNDLDSLIADMRAADFGVDPEVRVFCTLADCGREQRMPLPLERTFLRPRLGTTKAMTAPPEA